MKIAKFQRELQERFESLMSSFFMWMKHNKYRISFLVVFSLGLKLSSELPYINLLFRDPYFIYMPIIFLAILLLRVRLKYSIIAVLFLFVGACALFLIKQIGFAEIAANYVFIILLASVIQETFTL